MLLLVLFKTPLVSGAQWVKFQIHVSFKSDQCSSWGPVPLQAAELPT